jgi:pimeloyl-ACP methyl ester carboxylesterase
MEFPFIFVEEGQGPAVIFCHGFPAIWSSWKAQMEGVASAGFMAIALDMRGYGGSSAPVEAEAYTPYQRVGDLVASCPTWISDHPRRERLMFLGSRLVFTDRSISCGCITGFPPTSHTH